MALVTGYSLTSQDFATEVLYAVYENGSVVRTGDIALPNVHFNGPRPRRWHAVSELPQGVEYIGTYELPYMSLEKNRG